MAHHVYLSLTPCSVHFLHTTINTSPTSLGSLSPIALLTLTVGPGAHSSAHAPSGIAATCKLHSTTHPFDQVNASPLRRALLFALAPTHKQPRGASRVSHSLPSACISAGPHHLSTSLPHHCGHSVPAPCSRTKLYCNHLQVSLHTPSFRPSDDITPVSITPLHTGANSCFPSRCVSPILAGDGITPVSSTPLHTGANSCLPSRCVSPIWADCQSYNGHWEGSCPQPSSA